MRSLPAAIGAIALAFGASTTPSAAGEPRTVISTAPAAAPSARAAIVGGQVVLLERPLPYYYRVYPEHAPGYPKLLSGVVVPIYDTSRPVIHRRALVVATPRSRDAAAGRTADR